AASPDSSTHITLPESSGHTNGAKKIDLNTALQNRTAEGYPPLLSFIRQFTRNTLHPNIPYKGGAEVVLSCGSTDGFSKTLELFTNVWSADLGNKVDDRPGLLCEVFMYANVLNQAKPRGANIVPVAMDSEGML